MKKKYLKPTTEETIMSGGWLCEVDWSFTDSQQGEGGGFNGPPSSSGGAPYRFPY